MISRDLVQTVSNEISDNLWFCFIIAIAVLGTVIIEFLITLITYCICRKCFNEKVGELNVMPLP